MLNQINFKCNQLIEGEYIHMTNTNLLTITKEILLTYERRLFYTLAL